MGFGAAAVKLVTELVEELPVDHVNHTIRIYDSYPRAARGIAYSTGDSAHKTNMPVSEMSLHADRTGHFGDWCLERSDSDASNADRYPPRALFGDYLEDCFAHAARRAGERGIQIRTFSEQVTRLQVRSDYVRVTTSGGEHAADRVVLCVGNVPGTRFDHLHGEQGFFRSPYVDELQRPLAAGTSVAIVGSRLTAYDAALTQARLRHSGLLTFVTRTSGLPGVQPAQPALYTPRYLSEAWATSLLNSGRRVSTAELSSRLIQEFDAAGLTLRSRVRHHPSDPLATLERNIRLARRGASRGYDVLNAVGRISPHLWAILDDSSRELFLSDLRSSWVAHRHRVPLQTAMIVHQLMESGQLRLAQGLTAIHRLRRGFALEFAHNGRRSRLAADIVVEATGTEHNLEFVDSTLLHNMVQDGLLGADRFGGIAVERTTHRLLGPKNRWKPWPQIYFVGALTQGVHFYTNSMSTVTIHAAEVARHLVSTVQSAEARSKPHKAADLNQHAEGA